MVQNARINYGSRTRKRRRLVDKKRLVLSVLLTGSIGINMGNMIAKSINNLAYNVHYNYEINEYRHFVKDNIHRTADKQNYFINTSDVARSLSKVDYSNRDDFYHALISVAFNIDYNRNKNFSEIISYLDLDSLSQENSIFPSKAEFNDFLMEYGFKNSDGTIDFERWRDFDKKIINFEKDLDSFRK